MLTLPYLLVYLLSSSVFSIKPIEIIIEKDNGIKDPGKGQKPGPGDKAAISCTAIPEQFRLFLYL